MPDPNPLVSQGRMLSTAQVLEMWPISRKFLWKMTHHKEDAKRIPSYKFGSRILYAYDEIIYWRDQNKTNVKRAKEVIHAD